MILLLNNYNSQIVKILYEYTAVYKCNIVCKLQYIL